MLSASIFFFGILNVLQLTARLVRRCILIFRQASNSASIKSRAHKTGTASKSRTTRHFSRQSFIPSFAEPTTTPTLRESFFKHAAKLTEIKEIVKGWYACCFNFALTSYSTTGTVLSINKLNKEITGAKVVLTSQTTRVSFTDF